jgi:hypothetical protein
MKEKTMPQFSVTATGREVPAEKRTWRVSGRAIACLLFLYSIAHVASVLAQKPAKPEAQQVNKLKPAAADGKAENSPLPACLEKLS